ncbi:hypothetical protein CLAFUW4_13481 [Fulvia fulva]|uniref:DUF8212 domain-containing protein n=1 Tax=Passalora fulva TaxID=5499 RepID=A0A9Q8UVE9_PASFU|nr:uncharacterized protein CLAFUR5_13334 [Fulvia fulva]KAK4611607.1 hypothetical protein CLAFUR4_13484 [Fulvia fulva]KAK4612863.1 hypothetical protein CLAFUR0_13492 [Fulvia fulva]UJO23802.1 hypothetical protein CLAFUR5_13334 [Fulvia fulva]WPV21632.1 hypothetical protein CLAFUW4_13481 [Fulvia fulva]WPV35967.1 hypothetical protein CLAFUW7_13488 [Fulvia fulva]
MVPGMEKDAPLITKVTGIPEECLNDSGNVFRQSVTRRMSWAAGRTTTRREDEAYCLLGLFNVKMPLLYGERADAFLRLQEETMKRSNDESIFAWTSPAGPGQPTTAFLARRPAAFEHGGNVIRAALGDRNHYLLGAKGLELQAKTVVFEDMSASGWDGLERIFLLQLNCYTLLEDHRPQACLIAMAQYKDDLMARVPTWDIGQELWQRLIGSSNRPVRRNPEQMFLLAMTSTDFDEEELLSGHTAQRGTQTLDDLYGLLPQDRRDNLAEDRSQPTPPTIDLTREAM